MRQFPSLPPTATLCWLSTPFFLIVGSAATFDPVSTILFFGGLASAAVLLLVLIYFALSAQFVLALCAVAVEVTLALLIPLESTALQMIQLREKGACMFRGDAYKQYARSLKSPDGAGTWVIGHQQLAEYRLFLAPDQQTFDSVAHGFEWADCTISARRVNAEFGLLRLARM